MAYENILFQVETGIATITFNRPKALNALNSALLDEFSQALDEVAADESIRVLVLTGAGEKAFVAGADIGELAACNALTAKNFSRKGHNIIGKLQELPIAVIAAVNGFALGGGTEIAIACDFIYASENAKFGQPEINLGLIPGFGGTRHPEAATVNRSQQGQGNGVYRQNDIGCRSRTDGTGQQGGSSGSADGGSYQNGQRDRLKRQAFSADGQAGDKLWIKCRSGYRHSYRN